MTTPRISEQNPVIARRNTPGKLNAIDDDGSDAFPPPVVLVATVGEWMGRAIESTLATSRHIVVRAPSGGAVLETIRRVKPDAIIVDLDLPDIGGVEICQRLRSEPSFDRTTAIIVIASAPVPSATRKAVYAAGAWEFWVHPIDPELLQLKLDAFLRAKAALTTALEESITDASTGVLSQRGVEFWAEQLVARAQRNHEPLACVVLMPAPRDAGSDGDGISEMAGFIQSSRAHMRRSDIVGRLADGRLVLLAPDTNEGGVLKFVERLRQALERSAAGSPAGRISTDFLAGYCAVNDLAAQPLDSLELMRRASKALDHSTISPRDTLALSFDSLPIQ